MSASATAREDLNALAWSVWAELGVSGWERHHRRWCVDPEALVVFTVWLGDTDARLRDEATDWCVRYGTWLSATRLANVMAGASKQTLDRFGEFAATVCEHSPQRWRGATKARKYKPTGRSRLESFAAPSLVDMRLRALMGVGARAEVMRLLLSAPSVALPASDLVDDAGFKKRNIADALESLRWGGALAVERKRNQLQYFLADAHAWRSVVGELPDVWPRWTSLLTVLATLTDAQEKLEDVPTKVRNVELAKLVRAHAHAIERARLPAPPAPSAEVSFADAVSEWLGHVARELARGRWPGRVE